MRYASAGRNSTPAPNEAARSAPYRDFPPETSAVSPPAANRTARLPERVLKKIEEQRERSEILIGWVQAAVIALFAILYAVAPKTFMSDVPFRPVPWAISLYAAFTGLRLSLAYHRRLVSVILAASVVLDIAC